MSVASLLTAALSANDWAIGRFTQCSTSPDSPAYAHMDRWEARLERAAGNNGTIFGRLANLYHSDRCFVPRRVCKLHLRAPRATLLLPREGPSIVPLAPRRFDVVLGAAQVFGVLARTSFASLLEQAEDGLPVVNLGRGAAGPHIYTDKGNWPLLKPLFANARSVIICVMAGRSSPSSESGAFSGQSFGSEQLRAYDKVLKMWNAGGLQWRHADQLRRESLASATRDYVELASHIRGASAAAGHHTPPRILLVWFSACPIAGCTKLWNYPQYFLDRDSSAGGGYVGGGGGSSGRGAHGLPPEHALTHLGQSLGAEIVDASYGHVPPSPPLAIDQCASCVPSGAKLCSSPEARQDGVRSGKLCGSVCGSVRDPYYPDDAAHAYAAGVLLSVLRSPPEPAAFAHTAPAPPTVIDRGAVAERQLQRIALDGKLFHSHIHKASGSTFLSFVAGLEGVVDCSGEAGGRLIRIDHTKPTSADLFARWWKAPRPQCSFASLEEPELGTVYKQLQAGGAEAGPQIISFVRHPLARCRSHWRYEQSLCHRKPLGFHADYCNTHFLPKFGAVNNTATHVAFVAKHCTELASRSLTAANGIPDARRFLLQTAKFVGITEHFLESVCLFLYQAGRFRRDLCTCDGASGRPLRVARELSPPDDFDLEMQRRGAVGIPPLRLNEAELERRSPADLKLYAQLLKAFKQRIFALEEAVNASVWSCGHRRRQQQLRAAGLLFGGR